jgi:hypothetical protein
MNNERINLMLHHFIQGKKVADANLREFKFSDEEITQVEKSGYIEFIETTPWGDRRFTITTKGLAFRDD